MPPRTFWKGFLKLSLVTCPVQLVPAGTAQDRVSFRTLNVKTGNPVAGRYVDSESEKPVEDEDQVRGYPRGEDDYVILEDEDLEAVELESARTIDIETFVPDDAVGWIWYDRPHFLIPSDAVGEEAFAVIRSAMEATQRAGIARLVMQGRERAVLLRARGKGLVLWTLRYGDEVRSSMTYFDTDMEPADLPAEERKLMTTLIRERTGDWDPKLLDDPVQAHLREIIAAKSKGRKKPRPAADNDEPPKNNVVNIMDALRKSLRAEGAKETRPGGKAR
jgi:DNA end-binding protein Ku